MIKTTLGALFAANLSAAPGTPSPLGQLMMIQLPVTKAWERLSLFEDIEDELSRHTKLRTEIITRHGDKDDQGRVREILPTHPNFKLASREIAELESIEVVLDHEPIRVSTLGDGMISAHSLSVLKKFLLVP